MNLLVFLDKGKQVIKVILHIFNLGTTLVSEGLKQKSTLFYEGLSSVTEDSEEDIHSIIFEH